MLEHGLLPGLLAGALAEVERLRAPATPADPKIADLRRLPWASIDNDDSRDLDQLSVAAASPGGATTIHVAIADVDALVHKGSSIDGHARHNTTSVYTAAEIFPMLPERLSTDLTSLNEAEDRLAVVVSMPIAAGGVIGEAALQRALVHNHAKLTYAAVGAWLEGGSEPDAVTAVPGLADNLRLQDAAAQALKKLRQESGSLSLETIEPRAVFVGDELADLRAEARNRAKDLIEELMIATNGVTARFLEAHGFASVRRVLKSPERWGRIVEIAAQLRETLPADPDAGALERFLARRRQADPARFPDLSLGIIKLLGSGSYEVEVPGHPAPSHFGLAVQDYAHSTAPNRRYPDVITQRLVKAALAGQPSPYGRSELQALAGELHGAGRQCQESRAPGAQVGSGDAPRDAARRNVRRHRDGGRGQRHLGADLPSTGRGQGRRGRGRTRRRRAGPRAAPAHGRRAGIHRFRVRCGAFLSFAGARPPQTRTGRPHAA
jgi:exoribonuclease-2